MNLFASFLLFATLQLIKETFWVLSVGFPKDVIRESHLINKVTMNPNVSVCFYLNLFTLSMYKNEAINVNLFLALGM